MKHSITHKIGIEKRNGTIQSKRLAEYLLDSTFRIDDRAPWDVLSYIASYLEHVNYYSIDDRIEGNWRKYVEKDVIIFLASIIDYPTDDIDDLIRNYDYKKVKDDSTRRKIILILGQWWKKIHEWSRNLEKLDEKNLADKIKKSLVNGIMFNRDYILELGEGKIDMANLQNAAKNASNIGAILDEILHDFQKAIAHIKEIAKNHFKEYVISKADDQDNHLPHNAMYIAFALLFREVQGKLNELSKRHLDFYYKDILNQKHDKGRPVRAIVNFDLQPAVKGTVIPKGTRLSAGKAMGNDAEIIFETSKNLRAYPCELVNIQTLFINSNKYIEVGTTHPIISSVTYNKLMSYSEELISRDQWYVFGANKKTILDGEIDESRTGKLGFIIGSPVLFLSEGRREITIDFHLEETTSKAILWKLLHEIKCHKDYALNAVVSMVFDQAFIISYTNKKGWIPCEEYSIECDELQNCFTIKVLLDMTDPAMETGVNIEEELRWPSVKVELNEFAPIYVYSFFKEVEIETIAIDVAVQEMKNLSLYNNISKIPLGKPIELFGPEPKKGAYMMLGHSELFKKHIEDVTVRIDWDNIPSDYGGFETYYDRYNAGIDNTTFQIQFSALSNGYWLPQNNADTNTKPLFNTTHCITPEGFDSVQLEKSSTIDFDTFKELLITPHYELQDPLLYSITSGSGFIKMTLTGPEFGFGSDLYQQEFIDIATYNAKNKKQLPYPNKPFVPKIKEVALNYKASDRLSFVEKIVTNDSTNMYEGEFKHIKPYMVEDVIVNQMVRKHTLLANFTEEGYLILGIKGAVGGTDLNIFFNFLRSSTTTAIKDNTLNWEYLSVPNWQPFERSAIIRDNTEGFIKSGIVQLIVPHLTVKEKGNVDDITWIRATTREDVENYPKIKGIYLNAVEARCMDDDPTIIGRKIKAESIHKIDGKLPDVKRVYQAAETYAGRIPEMEDQFYTRVSERLKHKGRAVTLWDYERIILENFPDVKVVKCTSFNESFEPVPGHVKVIVLSKRWTDEDPYYYSKMVLKRMKDFLNKISSSFIDIEVINPSVERLIVNCNVLFNRIDPGRNYRQKLSEEITKFLSPIDTMTTNKGGIGGSIMPSTISNYIENLPYVKRLEKFNVEHIIRKGTNTYTLDTHDREKIITAQTPWSVLAPLKGRHRIMIREDRSPIEEVNDLNVGVGLMGVGVDFIIGEEL